MAIRFRPKRKRVKRNPSRPKIKYRTRTKTIVKRVRANPPKRSRRRIRRNPSGRGIAGSLRGMLPQIAMIGGGFIVGVYSVKLIPASVPVKARGLVPAVLGAVAAGFVKSTHLRNMAIGFAASGVFDLARQNIPSLTLAELDNLGETDSLGMDTDAFGDDSETLGGDMSAFSADYGDSEF